MSNETMIIIAAGVLSTNAGRVKEDSALMAVQGPGQDGRRSTTYFPAKHIPHASQNVVVFQGFDRRDITVKEAFALLKHESLEDLHRHFGNCQPEQRRVDKPVPADKAHAHWSEKLDGRSAAAIARRLNVGSLEGVDPIDAVNALQKIDELKYASMVLDVCGGPIDPPPTPPTPPAAPAAQPVPVETDVDTRLDQLETMVKAIFERVQ